MNLRNLVNWQLVHKVHFKGKRKDFYTAEKEVWTIVATIVRERQQREVTPIRENLEECLALFKEESKQTPQEQEFRKRIENFTEFLEMFERFTAALLPYINKKNITFLKHLVKLAELKDSIKGETPGENDH